MSLSLAAARPLLPIVYTPEDVERHIGVAFTAEQRTALREIPFSAATLRSCAGTHMLFPAFPLSLLEIRDKHPELFCGKKVECWYAEEREAFSRIPLPLRWHLLRTEPVPGSYSKNWEGQQTLFQANDVVPPSALVAVAAVLHYRATGRRLFECCYVHTADLDAGGSRVCLGCFFASGLRVSYHWDGYADGSLGLVSAREVP